MNNDNDEKVILPKACDSEKTINNNEVYPKSCAYISDDTKLGESYI